jgi:phosphoglucosamine mutase
MINVPVLAGRDWAHQPGFVQARQAAADRLGSHGRMVIRASGTEPVVRVMVEEKDVGLAQQTAEDLAASLN